MAVFKAAAGQPLSLLLYLPVTGVTVKCPRRRKLAKLMTDHVLGNKDRDELFSIMNGKGQTYHVRYDIGPPRPGLDDLA